MLQSIRDRSQGVIASVIIGVLVLSFALWGIHNYFYGSSQQKPIAKVNGEKISQQQFSTNFERFRQAQMQQNPQLFSSQQQVAALKKRLLNSMIQSTLLNQSADKNGFGVGNTLLELSLAHMPLFQVNGEFSRYRFERFLAGMMYTQEQFFNSLRTSIITAQVRSGFVSTSFALPYQIDEAIKLITQKRAFHYVIVPAGRFLAQAKVTAQQVGQYYKSHQQLFTIPKKVSLSYVVLSLNALKAAIHPTKAQLHTYYENNVNHYTTPKRWQLARIFIGVAPGANKETQAAAKAKAEKIYQELKKGASFAELAKRYSDDLATSDKGGKMSWVSLLQVTTPLQQAIYSLKKIGQVSEPFKTEQGYQIVKLLAEKSAVVKPYHEVAKKVKSDYILQKAEKQYSNDNDTLANLTFEHPDTLLPAAKALNLSVKSTPLFSQNGGKEGLTKNLRVIKAAFSSEVLSQRNNSSPISIADGEVAVIRAKQIVPAKVKPLDEVKLGITKHLKQQQASEQAQKEAAGLLAELEAGKSFSQLTKAKGLVLHTTQPVARNKPGKVNGVVVETGFHLQRPTGKKIAATLTPVSSGGYAVVQLIKVINGSLPAKHKAQMSRYFAEGSAQGLGELEYYLYVHGLKQSADIQYYPQSS